MVTRACESLTADQRLYYVLLKLQENGGKDKGVPAMSQDGKYVDFGEECVTYSDHFGEQMHLRAWYSQPGKKCQIEGQMNLTFLNPDDSSYNVIIPNIDRPMASDLVELPVTPPQGYVAAMVARICRSKECDDVRAKMIEQFSLGFCESYKLADLKKSI